MTLICAKFDEDLINISKVTCRKTKWFHFFGLPGILHSLHSIMKVLCRSLGHYAPM